MTNASPGSPGSPGQPNIPYQGSAPPPPQQAPFPNIPGYPGPGPIPVPTPPPGFPGFPGQPPTPPPSRGASFKPWLIVIIVVVLASLVFGSIYVLDRAFGPPDLSGTWSISLSSSAGDQDGTMTLTELASSVSGTATFASDSTLGAETVSGSVLGKTFTLTFFGTGANADFVQLNGSFVDSTHLSGTFTSIFTDGSLSDSGTWTATKTS